MLPVGVRTLNESGSLGVWERPQIELFCICHLINVVLDVDEEWIVMDVHFAVGEASTIPVASCLTYFSQITHAVWGGIWCGGRHPRILDAPLLSQ